MNGSPDVYTFRYDGFASGDIIKLQLNSGVAGEQASIAGFMFDPVPEPASVAMAMVGGLGLARMARRFRPVLTSPFGAQRVLWRSAGMAPADRFFLDRCRDRQRGPTPCESKHLETSFPNMPRLASSSAKLDEAWTSSRRRSAPGRLRRHCLNLLTVLHAKDR